MRGAALALTALLALAGCVMLGAGPEAARGTSAASDLGTLPPMKSFGAVQVMPSFRPNAEIARDFLELAFEMESGRPLPQLTRFEGPITLRLTGPVPATARRDTARLLARLRNEAGISITEVAGDAAITVEFLPRARMQALVPQAACFVVPRVSGWDEYRRARMSATVDWATLERRDRVAIFVPSDTSPQEIRDCLHEEVAQALGPLNDIYRLPDSVFNDDNFHTVLTGFDMLILRIFYAPELGSGMDRRMVAERLPAILARLNPGAGSGMAGSGMAGADPTPRAFVEAIEAALGTRSNDDRRRSAARQAVAIAERAGWTDARAGFAWFAQGRMLLGSDLGAAEAAFQRARAIYLGGSGMALQAAHADMQLAAFALTQGRIDEALARVSSALPAAERAENAALMATLLLMRAEALELGGRNTEAAAARQSALGWARYGFGSDADVRRRQTEITGLARKSKGGA